MKPCSPNNGSRAKGGERGGARSRTKISSPGFAKQIPQPGALEDTRPDGEAGADEGAAMTEPDLWEGATLSCPRSSRPETRGAARPDRERRSASSARSRVHREQRR